MLKMLKEIVFLKFLSGVFLMVLNAKSVEREFSFLGGMGERTTITRYFFIVNVSTFKGVVVIISSGTTASI